MLQRRPANRVDVWEQGRYRRILGSPPKLAWVEVMNRGSIDDPDMRYALRSAGIPPARRLELGRGAAPGLRGLMHLRAGAPLERLIERFGDYRGYLYFHALGGRLLAKGLIHGCS